MLSLGTNLDGAPQSLDLKSLATHAFILGMTGSGKTGLAVVLVEELLRAGVPVLAVDSKGDLATLLLSFAPDDARLEQFAPGAGARVTAALPKLGLSAEQLAAFRATYESRLYTPGSSLGVPVDLLGSLAPPASSEPELVSAAAEGLVRALLGLVGVDADPLTSREYLLLVQIVTRFWEQGTTPTLVDLVKSVATPPFASVGALALDDFFPASERQGLMVRLNALLISPRFAAWRTGEPLDPQTMLYAADGRPRLSVYSVAHLNDDERVFAVAALLERTQAWVRRQGGASTVRAVLLIDEIFGYFPPAPANPPTKQPLLGLLKQARAFGLSVVLATQNPIDLDYRGLANIGTWLVGRLQSEQDKARIRDALVGAAAASGVTGAQLDELISKLEPRRFLLHSVHVPKPSVFLSRDAMTPLRGPFSADELRALSATMKSGVVASSAPAKPTTSVSVLVDPQLGPTFEDDSGQARAFLLLKFGVRYRVGTVASEETMHELAFPLDGTATPAESLEGEPLSVRGVPFLTAQPDGLTTGELPPWVASAKYAKVEAALKTRLPSKLETKLLQDPLTKLISGPTETLEAFAARVVAKQGVHRDVLKLTRDLEKKRADLAQAEKEVSSRKAEKWLSVGAGVMGLFGGRSRSLSGVGRALTSNRQQGSAESRVEDLQLAIEQLERQLTQQEAIDPARFVEHLCVPRAADVQVLRLQLAWIVP